MPFAARRLSHPRLRLRHRSHRSENSHLLHLRPTGKFAGSESALQSVGNTMPAVSLASHALFLTVIRESWTKSSYRSCNNNTVATRPYLPCRTRRITGGNGTPAGWDTCPGRLRWVEAFHRGLVSKRVKMGWTENWSRNGEWNPWIDFYGRNSRIQSSHIVLGHFFPKWNAFRFTSNNANEWNALKERNLLDIHMTITMQACTLTEYFAYFYIMISYVEGVRID